MPYKVVKQGSKYIVYKKDTGERVGATAGDKESLRKYLAALHINAKENINEADDAEFQSKLETMFKQRYPNFMLKLGSSVTDPKFRQFIKDTDISKSEVKLAAIPVIKLKPTQNEIDVDKSLKFPLTDEAAMEYALKGGVVKVASPIIVFNGKFIIDGHHRWSQLYAVNKDAKIVAYNFTNPDITNPLDALKATQLAIIGAGATKIQKATVNGDNLLKITEEALKKYVIETITDPVVEVFSGMKQLGSKEEIANYIWNNVRSMKVTSQPVPTAPGRGIMPQADAVPGGLIKTIATLKQGIPLPQQQAVTELRKLVRQAILKEIRKSK